MVHENEIMEDSYESFGNSYESYENSDVIDLSFLFKEKIEEGARIYNIFSCLDMIRHNETVPGIAYMCVCFLYHH